MRVAVLQFPGSNCDADAFHAFETVLGVPTRLVWHKDTSLGGADLVVVPGGFSYGDYLRCGAIARFSPIMRSVAAHAERGGAVLGICNGFQILCEAGLLPGALIRNEGLLFRCETVHLVPDAAARRLGIEGHGDGGTLRLPIAHGEGNYRIDPAGRERLERRGQILLRYADGAGRPGGVNPNGSLDAIAGVCSEDGRVIGLMPHPERAVEGHHPSTDGLALLRAVLRLAAPAAPFA